VNNRMWVQLGRFCGLMCVGSVVGAVAWGAAMQDISLEYQAVFDKHSISNRQYFAMFASAYRWQATTNILQPVEFLCFVILKLMMLGRLTNNATRRLQAYVQEQGGDRGDSVSRGALARVQQVYRALAAVVALCSVGGIVALDVAGAYISQAAGLNDQAAAACDSRDKATNSSFALLDEANAIRAQADTAASVQAVLEAIALLLISAAYLILVPLSVAMFRRAERVGAHALAIVAARADAGDPMARRSAEAASIVDETMQAAAEQRRHLVFACVVVLITFPARAALVLLRAYASFNNQINPVCRRCDPCQSDQFLINEWLGFTPEFAPIFEALSSPLTLVVTLWIITGAQAQAYRISLNILRARLGR